MKGNGSFYPNEHQHPLKVLQSLNHWMIPKLISYDNETYTCERIEGLSLAEYVRKNRDAAFALKVIQDVNNFMHDLTKFTKVDKSGQELQFSCEDIHEANMIVTENGKPYIIDFDQFGYYPSYTIFKLLQSANYRLCDSIRSALLLADTDHIENIKNSYKNRIEKLETKLLEFVE